MMNAFFQTLISIGKILIRSQFNLKRTKSSHSKVIIIGNGPSAATYFNQAATSPSQIPVWGVNMMAATEHFETLKPAYYLVSDHAFLDFSKDAFEDATQLPRLKYQPDFLQIQQRINATWNQLLNASWNMTVFIPQLYKNEYIVKLGLEKGLNIQFYNYTVVKGFTGFENWIYRKGWGSPQSQNVINSCIFQSINSNFQEVYLIGVDNNFHLNMIVDENNNLQHVDDHFYKVEKKITPQKHANGTPVKMHEFFLSLHKAFYAHHRLQKYAETQNVKIYNATKGSFIDAYPRKEIDFI